MRYKKKPVVIEAVNFYGFTDPMFSERPSWLEEAFKNDIVFIKEYNGKLGIHTLEGLMEASEGDYIVKGVDGELYACKPGIFKKTYEVVK
ncbi:hypothetical protein [Lactobacillus phage Lbab1]|nr:hypothetical protein [Lactobacillus phage Lbab1]